jgi:hypothetical protein
MSSSSAGKFQDHYDVLGVDPKAPVELIERAFEELSTTFHPDNPETGDQEKFDAVVLAHEVLTDSLLRREFDKIKGVGVEADAPRFSGPSFFESLGRETGLRTALLCVLYDRRRLKPFTPSMTLRHIEGIIEATPEEMDFAIWYLKQRGLATMDDKSKLQITVDGMDMIEGSRPSATMVMPYIKTAPDPLPEVKAVEPEPAKTPRKEAPPKETIPKLLVAKEPALDRPRLGSRIMGLIKQ